MRREGERMAQCGVGGQAAWERRQRDREARWRAHVKAWRVGGGSQAEYCGRHGLAPADFSWWKHELARRDGRAAVSERPAFVPLVLKPDAVCTDESSHCQAILKNGRRLNIGPGVSAQRVAELATVLERLPPC